jgi:hypothetical protein
VAALLSGDVWAGDPLRADSEPPLGALPSSNVDFVNHILGHCYNVFVQGNYLHTHLQRQYVMVDVSDPRYPVILGRSAVLPDDVADVAAEGHYAYVANRSGDLRVIDVSEPSTPEVVAVVEREGDATALAVADHRAYVAFDEGWYIFDLSDPEHPTELSYSETPQYIEGITVAGDYAYFAAVGEGLVIADVSDPAHPHVVGSYDTPGPAHQVVVGGDYAYLVDDYDGLRIFFVADRSAPMLAGSYNTAGIARGVALVGHHLYLADGLQGLRVFDVSNVAVPVEVGWYDTPNDAFALAAMERYAFVADTYGGLLILRYTGPLTTPTPTPTSTSTPTATPTNTPTPTATSTSTPTPTPTANYPPENFNLWPDHGGRPAGRRVNFTGTYRDLDGWRDLSQAFLHIGSTTAKRNNCRLRYDVRRNEMYLLNNTGRGWLGGFTPGSPRVIRNRQCTLSCANSAVLTSGRTVKVTWNLVFRTSFRGTKNSYMQAVDIPGARTALQKMGTWRVK